MKLKLVLATSTALGLLFATGAYAGSNNNALVIEGNTNGTSTGNHLSIDQTAANNSTVGLSTSNPANALPAYQAGSVDTLDVHQSGNNDSVGAATDLGLLTNPLGLSVGRPGVTQNLYDDYIHVVQSGTNDDVGVVNQTGWTADNGKFENQVNVTQSGNNEEVRNIVQSYYGNGLVGAAVGTSGYGYGPNVADVEQAGGNNNVTEINQVGGGNTANLNMTNTGGTANGQGYFNPVSAAGLVSGEDNVFLAWLLDQDGGTLGSYVGMYGISPQGTVQQIGHANELQVTIDATGTKYGFSSTGNYDKVNGTIGGNSNAIAVQQLLGNSNTAAFTENGSSNDIGIAQAGSTNTGTADTLGIAANNHIGLIQVGLGTGANTATAKVTNGSNNIVAGVQISVAGTNTIDTELRGSNNLVGGLQISNGGNNVSNVNGSGSRNLVATVQYGTSGTNTANVTVNGSNNNHAFLYSAGSASRAAQWANSSLYWDLPYSGVGGEVRGAISALPGFLGNALLGTDVLTPGVMSQIGGGNNLAMNVSSNDNLFSTLQVGTSNSINSTIGGGGHNQLAVAQWGSGNSASTFQNGSSNSIGLTQNGSNTATISQ